MTAPARAPDGAGAAAELTATLAQLARLGQEHTQLLARHLQMADAAQGAILELEAKRVEITMLRQVNAHLRSLIATGQVQAVSGPSLITGPQASDLLLLTALVLAPGPHDVIGLLLSASTTACLLAEQPRGALLAGAEVFAAALADFDRCRAAAAEPAQVPS